MKGQARLDSHVREPVPPLRGGNHRQVNVVIESVRTISIGRDCPDRRPVVMVSIVRSSMAADGPMRERVAHVITHQTPLPSLSGRIAAGYPRAGAGICPK